MKILLDIKESKVPFLMELLDNFSFVKTRPVTDEAEDDFLYAVSESVLAKDWLNKFEDEAWKNL